MGQAVGASVRNVVMGQVAGSAEQEVTWPGEESHPVGAIAAPDAVHAGLRAPGRESFRDV